jgi:hypothetical protein
MERQGLNTANQFRELSRIGGKKLFLVRHMGMGGDSQRVNMVKPCVLKYANWDTCREERGGGKVGHIGTYGGRSEQAHAHPLDSAPRRIGAGRVTAARRRALPEGRGRQAAKGGYLSALKGISPSGREKCSELGKCQYMGYIFKFSNRHIFKLPALPTIFAVNNQKT